MWEPQQMAAAIAAGQSQQSQPLLHQLQLLQSLQTFQAAASEAQKNAGGDLFQSSKLLQEFTRSHGNSPMVSYPSTSQFNGSNVVTNSVPSPSRQSSYCTSTPLTKRKSNEDFDGSPLKRSPDTSMNSTGEIYSIFKTVN